jgi:hypothetical protein
MRIQVRQPVRHLFFAGLAAAVIALVSLAVGVRAQVQTPRPADLRFEMLLSEPIALAGRTGVVAGTSAAVVKDRRTGQCHVAITIGSAMGLAPTDCGQ